MQVILLDKVVNLGTLGEIVKVKDGYARNFLIPSGRARRATEAAKAEFEAKRAELEKAAAAKLAEAQKQGEKLGGPQIRIWRGLAPGHLVTAHREREVMTSNAFQCTIGESTIGVGHQRHRGALGHKTFQQLEGTVTPRQTLVEQFGGVRVQPADRLRHRGRVEVEAELGVDGDHRLFGRRSHQRGARLAAHLGVVGLVELGK